MTPVSDQTAPPPAKIKGIDRRLLIGGSVALVAVLGGVWYYRRTRGDTTVAVDPATGSIGDGAYSNPNPVTSVDTTSSVLGEDAIVTNDQWARTVIESQITGGHALGWGDFDGDGSDELAVGWRDQKPGVAIYSVDREGALTASLASRLGGLAEAAARTTRPMRQV